MRCWPLFIVIWSRLAVSLSAPIAAQVTTIAVTGEDVPGLPGATFAGFDSGLLNDAGQLAFFASLEQGIGGVTAESDQGLWLLDDTSGWLLARTGAGGVADLPGANFQTLSALAMDDAGHVVFRSRLEVGPGGITSDTDEGVWRYSTDAGSMVAQTHVGNVPDVSGAEFDFLPFTVHTTPMGRMTLAATMQFGIGPVTTDNDRAVWVYSQSGASLIVREDISSVPGVPGGSFSTFGVPTANDSDQLVTFASLKTGVGVTPASAAGIWRFTGSSGEMLARLGSGNVPGVTGANFTGFVPPLLNDGGKVVVEGTLDTPAGNQGIWLYDGPVGSLLARSASGGVPDVLGANFADLDSPRLNEADQILFGATLEVGSGDVTAANQYGLWLYGDSAMLLARSGSGTVPQIPGANFADFHDYALNDQGQVAVSAQLEIGAGGVDGSNDQGIWLLDPQGDSRLVVRSGDLLAGHTIASLALVDSDGRGGGFNDRGQLAFQATFTTGGSGLFLFSSFTADFDGDSDVDADDLEQWQGDYGGGGSDADDDGDSDGADLLAWQRQYGGGVAPLASSQAVPEPASFSLVWIALTVFSCLRRAAVA